MEKIIQKKTKYNSLFLLSLYKCYAMSVCESRMNIIYTVDIHV